MYNYIVYKYTSSQVYMQYVAKCSMCNELAIGAVYSI